MLHGIKLEPQKNSAKVEVKIAKKYRIFDRPLQRALLYSFLFHALLFGLFRIQYSGPDDHEEIALAPIQVAVEEAPELHAAIAEVEETAKKERLPLDRELLQTLAHMNEERAAFELLADQREFRYDFREVPKAHEAVDWSERLYPLHLKFSRALQKLTLMEDGSELFCFKTDGRLGGPFEQALLHYPIAYQITVSGTTGKIIRSSRRKELLDKKLQLLADRLVEKIAFRPFEAKEIEGRLTIIFHASGNDVEAILQ